MRFDWGRLNFHMAIDECMTRPDDAVLGRWYREFCRDLLHQDDPKTMLGKDVIEESRRLYEADRKKRQRELKIEKDSSEIVPQCPTMSPQCPADVPKHGNGNGIPSSTLIVPKRNTVPAREKQKQHTPNDVQEMVAYGAEIGLSADECAKAYDYYASKGWKVSNSPMKDWKATLRNWKRRLDERQSSPPPAQRPPLRPQYRNQFDDMRELGEWAKQRAAEGKPVVPNYEGIL